MKRKFEDISVKPPTNSGVKLERSITLPISPDIWVFKIIPTLPAISILALQLTCLDFQFLVAKTEEQTKTKEKKVTIPLFKNMYIKGCRSNNISDILRYGSPIQFEWYLDLECKAKHSFGHSKWTIDGFRNVYTHDFLEKKHLDEIYMLKRMDFVKYFKKEVAKILSISAYTIYRNNSSMHKNYSTSMFDFNPWVGANASPRWKNIICWLVKNADSEFLLEMMKAIGLHQDIVECNADTQFASYHLLGLLILRDDEKLLEMYMDPTFEHSKIREDFNYFCQTRDTNETDPKYTYGTETKYTLDPFWSRLERFCPSEKLYLWCQKNIPKPDNMPSWSNFQDLVEYQQMQYTEHPYIDDTPTSLKALVYEEF